MVFDKCSLTIEKHQEYSEVIKYLWIPVMPWMMRDRQTVKYMRATKNAPS